MWVSTSTIQRGYQVNALVSPTATTAWIEMGRIEMAVGFWLALLGLAR